MSFQIFFKDSGAGLSSVKSTCSGDGIVSAAAGDGCVSASVAGDGSVSDAAGDGIVAADVAGDGSAVGHTGVSGRLRAGADGALSL